MKVAVYSTHGFEKPYLIKACGDDHELIFIEEELSEHTVEMARSCIAVALFTSDRANAQIIEKLSGFGIKYLVLRSVGFDHVDLNAAGKFDVKVANVPAYSPYAVAEHAVALLMALNRKLLPAQKLMDANDFRLDGLTGFDVHGKTVGIIGFGKIGQAFAKIMNGFGCRVMCYDPQPMHESIIGQNVEFVKLEVLFMTSDIISIHCPLNKSTHHLLNKEAFNLMKKGVFLINTARGPIIKTDDLIDALAAGQIGAAGLDVYEFEKGLFFHDHRNELVTDKLFEKLRNFKNVLISGHQAFLTDAALKGIADTTAFNLNCFNKGIDTINEL